MVITIYRLEDKPYLLCGACGQMNATEAWWCLAFGDMKSMASLVPLAHQCREAILAKRQTV
mgnify:CR=1 FL=1